MSKIVKPNPSRWKPGESGNMKGRPPKGKALTELLKLRSEEVVVIGGVERTAREALADAVWQFVVNGKVWLGAKELEAENITDWANVVKWLYSYVEPSNRVEPETEMIVRVVREQHPIPLFPSDSEGENNPLPLAPSLRSGEGEQESDVEGREWDDGR